MEIKEFIEIEKDEPSWLKEYRKKSFEKLKLSAMPSTKYGLSIFIRPEFDFNSVKPVKVKVKRELKLPEGATIGKSDHAKEFFGENWKEENHKLYHFHQAFANDILSLEIKESLRGPIAVVYDVSETPLLSTILVKAGKNSKAKILLVKSGKGKGYVSDDVRVIAEQGSQIDIITVQNLSKDYAAFQHRHSITKRDAAVNWIDVCLGTQYAKSDFIGDLVEEGAKGTIKVLFFANEKQRFDIYTAHDHKARNTYSDILTKGAVDNDAKALSRGLVKIESNAFGSNGYEKQDVLLLSDTAEADAIPNLEIDNYDVKCSHGSTIGQVDANKLFYLMARGIDKENAVKLIVEGYFTPVLEMFDAETRENIEGYIRGAMHAD